MEHLLVCLFCSQQAFKVLTVAVNESAEAIIRHSLALHPNIVGISNDDVVTLLQISSPASHGRMPAQQQVQEFAVMQNAAQHIMLSLYRNQAIHVFLRSAMVSLAINSCKEEELSLGEPDTTHFFCEFLPQIFHIVYSSIHIEVLYVEHSCTHFPSSFLHVCVCP